MVKLFKSEAMKLKNKWELYISIILAVLSLFVIFLVFSSRTNTDISMKLDIQMFLVLVTISLNSLFLIRQVCLMERKANNFQNILSYKKPARLWIYKILLIVLIQFVLFGMAEIIGLTIMKQKVDIARVLIGIFIHILLSVNIHIYLQGRFGDYPNIIIGVFEIILIIFSTNIPMGNWYFFPCCYGYKIYENFYSINLTQWLVVLAVVLVSGLLNILLVVRNKFNYK